MLGIFTSSYKKFPSTTIDLISIKSDPSNMVSKVLPIYYLRPVFKPMSICIHSAFRYTLTHSHFPNINCLSLELLASIIYLWRLFKTHPRVRVTYSSVKCDREGRGALGFCHTILQSNLQ